MSRDRIHFGFLNLGHFVDHYATLIFATAAALALSRDWGMSYAQLAPYATPGFIAFGLFSLPAGWLADRWSRDGMMVLFFVGIGLSALLCGFAATPMQLGVALFIVGMFAAIYHPVGLAMVMSKHAKAGMALAINGVWGNLGVACAALATGLLIDTFGWRSAFIIPGLISIAAGAVYAWYFWDDVSRLNPTAGNVAASAAAAKSMPADERRQMLMLSATILVLLTLSGFIFQSTCFALPKLFEERLGGNGVSATLVGWMTFIVFTVGSMAQLVVGHYLDRIGIKPILLFVAAVQVLFFSLMPGQSSWISVLIACGFMLGSFGQLPITDFMVGKMARSELRSTVYGARYVVTCLVFASAIPVIAWLHHGWGFDTLFRVLSVVAVAMIGVILLLPGKMPEPGAAPKPVAAE